MFKNTYFAASLVILLMISLIFLSTFQTKVLAADDDSATINVSIQAVSEITVFPNALAWNNVQPGKAGGTKLLDIRNTGSLNVTNVYAYVDTMVDETIRPYGTANATNYAVGGVIVFTNETYNKFFFAGRQEWNWTEDISNMNKGNVNSPAAWGFFRNTSFEYNWLVGNGTNGTCSNNSATQFAISDYADNGTNVTREPTTGSIDCNVYDENYTYCSVNRGSAPIYESCVAIYKDCSRIYIYRYDKRDDQWGNFTSCANANYVQVPNLPPGDVHTLTLDVYIPYGTPNGNLNTSTFTVYAT
jgi:hypothetical protein